MTGGTLGDYAGGRFARRVDECLPRAAVIAFGLVLSAVYFTRPAP